MLTWNTNTNAPCCPGEIVDDDTGQRTLIQTDWDYPSTADTFGWDKGTVQRCPQCTVGIAADTIDVNCYDCGHQFKSCEHHGTDGTVDCPDCGVTTSDFITAAGEYLDDNDGATAEGGTS